MDDRLLNAQVAEVVFGESLRADTEARLGKAAMSGFSFSSPVDRNRTGYGFYWNGRRYEFQLDRSCFNYGGAHGNDGYGLYFWHDRHGQPYQADIEAHVAAWRETPYPYGSSWDGMAKVIDALRGRGLYVDIRTCADFFEVSVTTNGHALVYASADPSAPRAVAITAIEAVRWLSKGGA
jgi:hypothetical protein